MNIYIHMKYKCIFYRFITILNSSFATFDTNNSHVTLHIMVYLFNILLQMH